MIKLLDFYATWCGPCKMLSPIIDELSEDRSLEVVKIDIDKNEDLVKEFGIMSVPTIVLLKDNKTYQIHLLLYVLGLSPRKQIWNHRICNHQVLQGIYTHPIVLSL